MKKFLALALAIVVMMAMAVPAFAAADPVKIDQDTVEAGTDSGDVNITYTVDETYEVEIPADITIQAGTPATLTVTADKVHIQGNQTLTVTVESDNYVDEETEDYVVGWYLVDATGYSKNVLYTMEDDASADVASGDIILTATTPAQANAAAKTTEVLTLNTAGTAQVGTYTDQLTFTVAVVLTSSLGA